MSVCCVPVLTKVLPRPAAKDPFDAREGLQLPVAEDGAVAVSPRLQLPAGPAAGEACDATADAAHEWLACQAAHAGLCAGSSRPLCRAGRRCGCDAGGAKPLSGRPHGAEQRGRSVGPVLRPYSAVAMAEGEAVLCCRGPGAAGAAPGERRRALPRSRWGGCPQAGGGAAAPELQPSPSGCCRCCGRRRLRRVLGVASRERCDIAGMTGLLPALVLEALSAMQTDGAALSGKARDGRENAQRREQAGCILPMAQGTQKICLP
ncbi:uncharacterized protein LOC141728493 [Zonotrichia albicollis]|uniref:uncharacterized protein LOC141728493 n=1 Tax=Zonotrichia albicollis TaxID=44394 RepID=UPI003D80D595